MLNRVVPGDRPSRNWRIVESRSRGGLNKERKSCGHRCSPRMHVQSEKLPLCCFYPHDEQSKRAVGANEANGPKGLGQGAALVSLHSQAGCAHSGGKADRGPCVFFLHGSDNEPRENRRQP